MVNKTLKSHIKYSHNKKKTRIKTPYRVSNIHKPTNQTIIGVVYANWCASCQSLMPDWLKIENNLKNVNHIKVFSIEETDSQTQINTINNTYLQNSMDKLTVNGYPTIFKITNTGVLEYYTGNRQYNELLNWANSRVNIKVGGKTQKNKKKLHNKTTNYNYKRLKP